MSKIDKFTQYKNRREKNIQTFETDRPFTVYLDMDGVLTDFDGDFKKIPSNKEKLSFEEYDKKYGKFSSWEIIGSEGLKWWSEMAWKNDGKELWDYMSQYDPTILSAPSRDPLSAKGKVIWVNRELGLDIKSATRSPKPNKWEEGSRMILSSQKYLFAKRYPNSILIDDTKKKIIDWRNNGGIGILHTDVKSTIKEFERIISYPYQYNI
jgi:hypothetical protein